MQDNTPDIQPLFLNTLRKNNTDVVIFLVNGVKLEGRITMFDKFSIILMRDKQSQLVFKHSISTIMPTTTVTI